MFRLIGRRDPAPVYRTDVERFVISRLTPKENDQTPHPTRNQFPLVVNALLTMKTLGAAR